ncbi:MAG: DUF1622 domain-containing protein [Candidatus Bathyarchaeota archaeon]|nr:DUF1622 domain-containing protein [Candidatus Bathyarchaeota archaeon]
MSECVVNRKKIDSLTLTLLTVIAVLAVIGAIFSSESAPFLSAMDEVILTLLTAATNILYIIGGGVIFFGACVVAVRFIQCKLSDSCKPSGATRFLSGYLTLSLEFFIGAEIIKTTTTRTWEEFSVLILIIFSRGLFSLILYLERRWHGAAETE